MSENTLAFYDHGIFKIEDVAAGGYRVELRYVRFVLWRPQSKLCKTKIRGDASESDPH
jgi:hypothetical protein